MKKINELMSDKSDIKLAVKNLKSRLEKLANSKDPDVSYDTIDGIMREICKSHGCKPKELHDQFIAHHNATPDSVVKKLLKDKSKQANETMQPGDVLMVENLREAVVGTVLSIDGDTIIIEGGSYRLNDIELLENQYDIDDHRLDEAANAAQQAAIAISMKKAGKKPKNEDVEETAIDESEYHGHKVQLGKPSAGDVKKYKVYVRDPKTGNIKKVNFGDKHMEIKRDDPERRKNFRARHGCGTPRASDRTKAAYWSCRLWSTKKVSDILKGK